MKCCENRLAVTPHTEDWLSVVIDPDLPPVPCRSSSLSLAHDDLCIIEIQDDRFVGKITLFTPPIVKRPKKLTGRVLGLASADDIKRKEDDKALEHEIELYVRLRTREMKLDLRPLKVRVPLSGRAAVIFFMAEQRVDFRPLLKELGQKFRRRIEMRALGVRDGAKLCGGLGPCGRSLCCSTFMVKFHSVTVRMAKRQNLSLNPAKISGLCGRLMCCLAHEVEQYPPLQKKKKRSS